MQIGTLNHQMSRKTLGTEMIEQIELQHTETPPPRPARRERTEQERLAGMNISVTGLSREVIARIEEIGFEAWLAVAEDVVPSKEIPIVLANLNPKKEREIKKLLCQRCGALFLSYTRATKLCPGCGGSTDILQKDGKQIRPCASGDKCLQAGKRLPAPAAPGKQYCSENCHGSQVARSARLNT